MSNIPPLDSLSDFVKAILAFLPDIEKAKSLVQQINILNTEKHQVNIKGNPTKQGRYALVIEGVLPKVFAYKILQKIEDLGGEIEAVAGK